MFRFPFWAILRAIKEFSGRYLNFLLQHPLCQKRGTIVGLIGAFLLSHPQFHQKNFYFIIKILLDNDYPLD